MYDLCPILLLATAFTMLPLWRLKSAYPIQAWALSLKSRTKVSTNLPMLRYTSYAHGLLDQTARLANVVPQGLIATRADQKHNG